MEHDKFKENLSAYMDGELKGEELRSLEAHLAACPDCARELAGLKKVSAIFKEHAPEAVPHPLKEAVFSGLKKPAAPSWLKPGLVFATAAAALLVVFALPRFRQAGRSVYSPGLFQNSYYEEEGAGLKGGLGFRAPAEEPPQPGAAPAGLAGEAPAAAEKKEQAVGSIPASPRYAVPAFRKTGAYGTAKSALASRGAGPEGYFSGDSAAGAAAPAPEAKAAPDRAREKAALPGWVSKLIKNYQADRPGNPPYEVWKYAYKGKTVYYLPPQCCDQYSRLYDEAGVELCAPDGGFAGNGDGRCADFYDEKKDGVLVWKDGRK